LGDELVAELKELISSLTGGLFFKLNDKLKFNFLSDN
jgi:hypothetical protein